MADEDKRIILVLPKQFFVDAFLLERGSFSAIDFKEQNHYRFIANVIIDVSASYPEYDKMAVTSITALNEFNELLNRKQLSIGSNEILMILKGVTYIIDTASINKLDQQESMIAIADRLYASSDYDPVIVVNPAGRENYMEAASRYYRNNHGKKSSTFPFKIYDPRQTKTFLEIRHPTECEEILKRTPEQYRIFD